VTLSIQIVSHLSFTDHHTTNVGWPVTAL